MYRLIANLSCIALLFSLVKCSPFEQNPEVSFPGNVLTPQINLKTRESSAVQIEYWPAGRPEKKLGSLISRGKTHAIKILNVKAATQYQYRAWINGVVASNEYFFQTDSVPKSVFEITKEKIDTTQFQDYILIRRFFRYGADAILDNEGDIVWYYQYDTAVRRAFTWTNQSTILSIYDSSTVQEIDLFGNTLLDLDLVEKNVTNKIHHEVLYDREQNILAITLDSARYDLRRFGGKQNQFLRADGLVLFTKTGQVLWSWNLLDVLNPNEFKGKINLNESWGHANAAAIDQDGNYLISMRDFNQIWKIDRSSGKLIWKLGEGGAFPLDQAHWFIRQHSVHFNPIGEVMLFDNGDLKLRPNSRVLSFSLDQSNKRAEIKTLLTLPRSLSSYRMCSAEWVENGKYLVCTTRKDAALTILNNAGEVLWKARANHASYRALHLKEPFRTVTAKIVKAIPD